jgi:23S rRNA (uridine2552-2'-O)-methyltransferase
MPLLIGSMDAIPGAVIIAPADFQKPETIRLICEAIGPERGVDVILSDMAPNTSGQADLDHIRIMDLAESVLEFAKDVLVPGGCCIVKLYVVR